jgi:preprotein translocase subunit YajC
MTVSLLTHALLLAQAPAGGAPAPGGGIFGGQFMMIGLMFVMMWVVLIRPQQKRMKEHQALVASAKVGDHVIMECGVHGIITSMKERTIMVRIADNVKVEYERSKIAAVTKKSDVVEAG